MSILRVTETRLYTNAHYTKELGTTRTTIITLDLIYYGISYVLVTCTPFLMVECCLLRIATTLVVAAPVTGLLVLREKRIKFSSVKKSTCTDHTHTSTKTATHACTGLHTENFGGGGKSQISEKWGGSRLV